MALVQKTVRSIPVFLQIETLPTPYRPFRPLDLQIKHGSLFGSGIYGIYGEGVKHLTRGGVPRAPARRLDLFDAA